MWYRCTCTCMCVVCVSYKHTPILTSPSLSPPPLPPGFPDHMSFPEFCRRYGTIERLDVPLNTREAVQQILMLQEVASHTYKLGISQVSCWGVAVLVRTFLSKGKVFHLLS